MIAAEIVGDAPAEAWVSAAAAAEYGPDGAPWFSERANVPIPVRIVPNGTRCIAPEDNDPVVGLQVEGITREWIRLTLTTTAQR